MRAGKQSSLIFNRLTPAPGVIEASTSSQELTNDERITTMSNIDRPATAGQLECIRRLARDTGQPVVKPHGERAVGSEIERLLILKEAQQYGMQTLAR